MGQVLANFLSTPLVAGIDGDSGVGCPYVAFDLDPAVVKASSKLGFPVLYGDGSRPSVLHSAGISSPKAVMVMYTGKKRTTDAVQRLRVTFPGIPISARAKDLKHLLDLKKAGATDAILENAETSLQLGSKLLKGLGVMSDDVSFLSQLVRDSMELQAQESQSKSDEKEAEIIMKPLEVRVPDFIGSSGVPIASTSPEDSSTRKGESVSSVEEFADQQPKHDNSSELIQSMNPEDDGVLYCALDRTNGLEITSGVTEVNNILTEVPSEH